jgi:hypothetical protein
MKPHHCTLPFWNGRHANYGLESISTITFGVTTEDSLIALLVEFGETMGAQITTHTYLVRRRELRTFHPMLSSRALAALTERNKSKIPTMGPI